MIVPEKVCLLWVANIAAEARRHVSRYFIKLTQSEVIRNLREIGGRCHTPPLFVVENPEADGYRPGPTPVGSMMWASDVPANISQAPPASRTSGSPTWFPRRFGMAIN